MTDVAIEILVPIGEDPLVHRAKVEARACELGWPASIRPVLFLPVAPILLSTWYGTWTTPVRRPM